MIDLQPEHFEKFVEELHGYTPFKWQQRLVDEVLAGKWPDALKLPTGSGKTSIIEIAIFALACEATRPQGERTVPRRLLYVVDRRIVVDEAFKRAARLADAIRNPPGPVTNLVAERLRIISGDADEDAPLDCFALRGGLYQDSSWVQHPGRATIITGTVDQIGSRLLFRGYGVTPRMRPIHAGLFGADALVVLDEAHCSNPFSQTLSWIGHHRKNESSGFTLPPFRVVEMTATPASKDARVFELLEEEKKDKFLKQRLEAPKFAMLLHAKKATGKNEEAEFAKAIILRLAEMLDSGSRKILVVVNRVGSARNIYQALGKSITTDVEFERELLTGRMRPLDRDRIATKLDEQYKLRSNAMESYDGPPVVVVSTQSIEVGADFDFDTLITECASLESLRQRFGRLDRAGNLDGAARAVIVGREAALKGSDPDPVYGQSLRACWNWLEAEIGNSDTINFGIQAFEALLDSRSTDLDVLNSPKVDAPILLESFLRLLVQTNPEPALSPDVSLFLHGPQRGVPEVYFCWRNDLPQLPQNDDSQEMISEIEAQWTEIVGAVPPVSTELLAVPLWLAEKWLHGQRIEGEPDSDQLGETRRTNENFSRGKNKTLISERRPLRWRGPEGSELMHSLEKSGLAPGDTLILPIQAGGMSELGTIPADLQHDIAEDAILLAKDKAVVRLRSSDIKEFLSDSDEDVQTELTDEWIELLAQMAVEKRVNLFPFVEKLAATVIHGTGRIEHLPALLDAVCHPRKVTVFPYPGNVGIVLSSKGRVHRIARTTQPLLDDREEQERTSYGEIPVPLGRHCAEVAAETSRLAELFGLPQPIKNFLVIAAELHDVGKADLRFQTLLNNGDEMAARLRPEPLAKSNSFGLTNSDHRRAWKASGLPDGFRHELISVALAKGALNGNEECASLILHLVASHHGFCRALAPIIWDDDSIETTLDWRGTLLSTTGDGDPADISSGICKRFWDCVGNFGWWGEAWIESILRLADQRCSSGVNRRTVDQ